jgi:signal transduction histidine kinase
MRDLSLHILDIIENSIRAGASEVRVAIEEDPAADLLKIVVEDNGPGLGLPEQVVLDPFYTTKKGKHVGLGLSLFREAALRAGGDLKLWKRPWG